MAKFKKLVVLDGTGMADIAFEQLHQYAETVEVHNDFPDDKTVANRMKGAEAVVLSWKTRLTGTHLENADKLKYIGLACSFYGADSSNVAVKIAKDRGITIKGIFDYGDPGVIEFILAEVISLLKGYGDYQWKPEVHELAGQKFGIIGLGTTGQLLAKALLALGVDVFYFSRTRKPAWESKGVQYRRLNELAEQCDFFSIHLPKNTKIITSAVFKAMGLGKIIINTSLGLPFQEKDFLKWVAQDGNFAVFDADGSDGLTKGALQQNRVIARDVSAGWSISTKRRRGEKVIENIADFLKV